MGLTNCNTQIWISQTSGLYKPYDDLYINTLIILRLLQGARLQQGRKGSCSNLAWPCMKLGCDNQKFPYGISYS